MRLRFSVGLFVLFSTVTFVAASARADESLFTFDSGFDFAKVEARDVRVSEVKIGAGSALGIASGHTERWPGVTLPAPNGHWDLSRFEYVAVDVKNTGNNAVTVSCRVDNPGSDGASKCVTASETLEPGQARTLRVAFNRPMPAGVKFISMRGYPGGVINKPTIDPREISQLIVYVASPKADHAFQIDNVRAGGVYRNADAESKKPGDFLPFIDEFGQYIHADWPGKTHSAEELAARRQAETAELAAKPQSQDWDQYGGWKTGPSLAATGRFRTEKYQGKWWLVDPEGKLFFSHGTDCVNVSQTTPLDERDGWFRGLPGVDSDLADCYSNSGPVLMGDLAGRRVRCFDFAKANLKRKYGADWRAAFAARTHQRLRSWGLNTIGNWSDAEIYLARKTPYVATVSARSRLLEGSQGYWGKFKDVFDPEFKSQLERQMAREKGRSAEDPWCIGFFVDNEIAWGEDLSLALATLASPADQPAKKVFVEDLKAKYGAVEKLNAAWGTGYATWDALVESRQTPDKKKAFDDLAAFYTKTAERYFSTCRQVVKEGAHNALYLGCRFAWVNDRAAAAAAKYCDVVSYNFYRRSVADFRFPGGADVPLMIGEFHFGALDRGMFHTGLVPTASQAERAQAYRDYVRGVLRHPQFVGCHWFQYIDQPTTGRSLDGENYQIGLVDIVDTPYVETVQALRDVGYGMYEERLKAAQ
ncbi:MAG: beta-agarase [Pirellulales bacterium]